MPLFSDAKQPRSGNVLQLPEKENDQAAGFSEPFQLQPLASFFIKAINIPLSPATHAAVSGYIPALQLSTEATQDSSQTISAQHLGNNEVKPAR